MRPSSPVLHILVHIAVCGCLVDASPHCTVKKCNDRLSTLIKKFKYCLLYFNGVYFQRPIICVYTRERECVLGIAWRTMRIILDGRPCKLTELLCWSMICDQSLLPAPRRGRCLMKICTCYSRRVCWRGFVAVQHFARLIYRFSGPMFRVFLLVTGSFMKATRTR